VGGSIVPAATSAIKQSRLHLEHFPSYAPELNPNDVEELVEDVVRSINGIRISTQIARLRTAIRTTLFCTSLSLYSGGNQ
jgi:hypothetical protein